MSERAISPWLVPALLALGLAGAAATAGADDMRDPLEPPQRAPSADAAEAVDPSAWSLSSTLVSDGRRVAIINGQVVAPGQRVDGARLVDVSRGEARLEAEGEAFTIRAATPQVRQNKQEEE